MSVTDPIVIPIEGDPSDFVKDSAKVNSELDKMAGHVKSSGTASATAARTGTTAWTEFRSMYSTVLDVARVGMQVWQETGGKFVAYAGQVRETSRALGTSTEEASRLIQIVDDVGISYQSLTTSLKMAQKDGIEPSVSGLAKLADEYNALAPGVERTQFLLDRFGKSGGEMGKLLEKGAEGINALNAGVDENMILTEKAVKQARDYEISVDALNDTWDAFTYMVAPPLIAATKTIIDSWRFAASVAEKMGDGMPFEEASRMALAEMDAADAAAALAQANEDATGTFNDAAAGLSAEERALKEMEDAAKAAAKELEAISDRNKSLLSLTEKLGDFQAQYADDHKQAVEDLTIAQTDLNDAVLKYGANSEEALSMGEKVADAQASLNELEISWHEATLRMIYDMVVTKLSIGGLTDAEFEAAIQMGITSGIYTEETAKMAREMWTTTDAIVAGIQQTENLKNAAYGASTAFQNLSSNAAFAATAAMRGRSAGQKRDSGGAGMAGTPYMIGTGAQPEMFIPSTNGTFVPNADKKGMMGGGSTYNIVVNNPKKETAENSIRKALKSLSYAGVAS